MADLIDRDALKKAMCKHCGYKGGCNYPKEYCWDMQTIDEQPSVDPFAKKPMYWNVVKSNTGDWLVCSNCRRFKVKRSELNGIRYCPRCSAEMNKSENPTGCEGAKMTEEVSMEVSTEVAKGDGNGQD